MEKRKESAELTRECITTALLVLVEEKPYENITITDITHKAGVSRMAYYRNYKSKDDIIISSMLEACDVLLGCIRDQKLTLRDIILRACEFAAEKNSLIKAVEKSGLADSAVGVISNLMSTLMSLGGLGNEDAYATAFYIGAIISVLRKWIKNDMKEDVDFIADILMENIGEKNEQRYYELRDTRWL